MDKQLQEEPFQSKLIQFTWTENKIPASQCIPSLHNLTKKHLWKQGLLCKSRNLLLETFSENVSIPVFFNLMRLS